MSNGQNTGRRYIPKFFTYDGSTEWRPNVAYSAKTIVTRNFRVYTSIVNVPSNIGAPENNPKYWQPAVITDEVMQTIIDELGKLDSDFSQFEDRLEVVENKVGELEIVISDVEDDVSQLKNALLSAVETADSKELATGDSIILLDHQPYSKIQKYNIPLITKQNGSGEPSLSNVRPIVPYSGVGVNLKSKNLLESDAQSATVYGVTGTVHEDKSITFNGTTTNDLNYRITGQVSLPVGSYIVTTGNVPTVDEYLGIEILNTSTGTKRYVGVRTVTTITIAANEIINSTYVNITSGKTVTNVTIYPMIRVASDPDNTYAPYVDTTIAETFNNVYAGFHDIISGILETNVQYSELDGTSSKKSFIGKSSASTVDMYYIGDNLIDQGIDKYGMTKCSHFKTVEFSEAFLSTEPSFSIYKAGNNSSLRISFAKSAGIDTLAKANQWLATQKANGTPVQVCYLITNLYQTKYQSNELILQPGKNVVTNNIESNAELTYYMNPQAFDETNAEYEGVPTYYRDHVDQKVSDIMVNMADAGRFGETFVFITDLHWDYNDRNSPSLVKYLLKRLNINAMVCGGDLIQHGTKPNMMNMMIDCVRSFANSRLPFPIAFGNHDSNKDDNSDSAQWFTADDVFSLMQKQASNRVHYLTTTDLSFYFDFTDTKTRFIVCDTGTNGAFTPYSELCTCLNSVDEGYNCIVVAHWLVSENVKSTFCVNLESIIDAYNSRGSVTIGQNSYSFANAQGKIPCVFAGHLHYDYDYSLESGIPFIFTDTDCGYLSKNTDKYIPDSITEQAFDVVTIDYVGKTVKCVRVGRGEDRSFTFT